MKPCVEPNTDPEDECCFSLQERQCLCECLAELASLSPGAAIILIDFREPDHLTIHVGSISSRLRDWTDDETIQGLIFEWKRGNITPLLLEEVGEWNGVAPKEDVTLQSATNSEEDNSVPELEFLRMHFAEPEDELTDAPIRLAAFGLSIVDPEGVVDEDDDTVFDPLSWANLPVEPGPPPRRRRILKPHPAAAALAVSP